MHVRTGYPRDAEFADESREPSKCYRNRIVPIPAVSFLLDINLNALADSHVRPDKLKSAIC
jgi:hypothetical protein